VKNELYSCEIEAPESHFRAIRHICGSLLRAVAHLSTGDRACFPPPFRAAAHAVHVQSRTFLFPFSAAKSNEYLVYDTGGFSTNLSVNSLRKPNTNGPPPDH
jgi:hypothetical protein